MNCVLKFKMNKFLEKNNIEYKISGIYNDIYKFELNNVTFHCKISGIKQTYYTMIVYVSQEIYEIKYNLLQSMKKNKIKLLGIVEHMNIYKFEGVYDNINEAINIIQLFT